MEDWEKEYEKEQNLNFVTRLLHSTRYKNLKEILQKLSKETPRIKIVDVGCGDCTSYKVISELGLDFEFFGVELAEGFVEIAEKRYGKNPNFSIVCDSIENRFEAFDNADIVIGLETFEHIPDPIVVRILEAIGKSNCKYLYITVPNEIGPILLIKNVGSFLMGYRRYQEYTWKETLALTFYDLDAVERHTVWHKGFDWRWLAHTIRQNLKITRMTKSPTNLIPKFLSPSIGFVCRNDKHSGEL